MSFTPRAVGGALITTTIKNLVLVATLLLLLPLLGKAATPAADLYGGIEIGGKGVKATVVKMTSTENGYDAQMLMQTSLNVTIMAGVESGGNFSVAAMDEAAKAVKQLYTEIQEKHAVTPERIYIVGSSGLLAGNKPQLAERVRSLTGKSMDFITVETESKLSMIGVVPEKYSRQALYLDIGSGNTKGGYRKGGSASDLADANFVMMSIPYGTVSFTTAITKASKNDPQSFAVQAKTLATDLLAPLLRQQVKEAPGLRKQQKIYLTGGLIWAVATLMHPQSRETFTRLTTADIRQFAKQASDNPETLLSPDLTKITEPQAREAARQEIQRVKEVFTAQNLSAGAALLHTLAEELAFADKTVYFARYGQVAWLFSYVVQHARK